MKDAHSVDSYDKSIFRFLFYAYPYLGQGLYLYAFQTDQPSKTGASFVFRHFDYLNSLMYWFEKYKYNYYTNRDL